MTGFLLDTNCISEMVRIKPELRAMAWIEVVESLLYLSVLTVGQIRKGLAGLPQGRRRSAWKRGSKSNYKRASPGGFCRLTLLSPIAGACSRQTPRLPETHYPS